MHCPIERLKLDEMRYARGEERRRLARRRLRYHQRTCPRCSRGLNVENRTGRRWKLRRDEHNRNLRA